MLPAIKSFAIAFAVSIIIFGTLGFIVTPLLKDMTSGFDSTSKPEDTQQTENNNTPDDDVDTDVTVPDNPALDINAESFTLLIVGTDYQPKVFNDYRVSISKNASIDDYIKNSRHYTADTILIIHADIKTGDFLITALPKNTRVVSHGITTTLAEAYETVTIEYFKQLISSIISLSIDHCIEMQVNMMKEVIDFMYPSGITYNIPYDMYYVNDEERVLTDGTSLEDYEYEYDENGNIINLPGTPFTIDLKKGVQKLDGEKSTHLIRYNLHSSGESKRCDIAIDFFKTIAEESFSSSDDDVLSVTGALNIIISSKDGKTDISSNDCKNIVEIFKNFEKFNVKALVIPGEYKTANGKDHFEYSYSAVHNLFSSYK